MINSCTPAFGQRLLKRPNAWAAVRGGEERPRLVGTVKFYQTTAGVLVAAEFWGLPKGEDGRDGIFGFHIHSGGDCMDTDGHLNPENVGHPHHAGDLPPVFANHGYGWGVCLTSRFTIREVIGRTVVLHAGRDDFTTQPSGNAGAMIACGVIR